MRKLIFLCHRRPDITHERYAELLLGGHVPLALRHHPAMRAYVVNVVAMGLLPGPRELDSIGELSFSSLDDYQSRLYDSPAGKETIQRDVAGFLAGSDAYDCTEHVRKGVEADPVERPAPPATPGAKLVLCLKRRPDLSHDAFVDHWLGTHAKLVLEHGERVRKYVQNVVDARLAEGGVAYDGFAELHFASEDDFLSQMTSHSQGPNPVQEDTANFVGEMAVWRVTEHIARRS